MLWNFFAELTVNKGLKGDLIRDFVSMAICIVVGGVLAFIVKGFKRIFGKEDDENAIILPKKQSSKKLSVKEKAKLKEYKDHTHTLELIVMILLLPPCLSLVFAAIFGALLNSPVAALIVGIIAYIVQVVAIIKLDKKRHR